MLRCLIFLLALLAGSLGATGAAAAAGLNANNSVAYALMFNRNEDVAGTNCGATATYSKELPAGSTSIKLVKPKVGDRDAPGGGTQVTAVSVTSTVISFTVVANGPAICDPAVSEQVPGEDLHWRATYEVRAEYSRRERSVLRIYYESYLFGAKWQTRPRWIQDSRKGTPRRFRQRVTGIKWSSFGGRKAVGTGTLRLDYCSSGDNCPQNGKKARLVASKPGFCKDSGKFEYLQLDTYLGRQLWSGGKMECG